MPVPSRSLCQGTSSRKTNVGAEGGQEASCKVELREQTQGRTALSGTEATIGEARERGGGA